jgi:hypothetical protein
MVVRKRVVRRGMGRMVAAGLGVMKFEDGIGELMLIEWAELELVLSWSCSGGRSLTVLRLI